MIVLSSGRPDKGVLETVADKVLSLPKAMWLDRTIQPVHPTEGSPSYRLGVVTNDLPIHSEFKRELINGTDGMSGRLLTLALSPLYIVASVVSLVALGVGLGLKQIAILTDSKSKSYRNCVSSFESLLQKTDRLKEFKIRLSGSQDELERIEKKVKKTRSTLQSSNSNFTEKLENELYLAHKKLNSASDRSSLHKLSPSLKSLDEKSKGELKSKIEEFENKLNPQGAISEEMRGLMTSLFAEKDAMGEVGLYIERQESMIKRLEKQIIKSQNSLNFNTETYNALFQTALSLNKSQNS